MRKLKHHEHKLLKKVDFLQVKRRVDAAARSMHRPGACKRMLAAAAAAAAATTRLGSVACLSLTAAFCL